jgi:uncharacterized cupredoxin-like copper-binding protein
MHRRWTIGRILAPGFLAALTPLHAQAPHVVTVYTADYAFTAPDTIGSGPTTFHLVNRGPSMHHMVMFALRPGVTLARFDHLMLTDSTDGSGHDGTGIVKVGGLDLADGAKEGTVTLDLAPGTYVFTCLLPLPDHSGTHRSRGMFRQLTVVPGKSKAASLPSPDLVVHLTDFAYDVPATLRAGHHLVRFENDGKHPHMAVIHRMSPGKTIADEKAWLASGGRGAEPSVSAGGATDLAPGRASLNALDLPPGRYFMACSASEGTAPRMHFQVGMFREFDVK